jgi:integrase
MIAKRTTKNGDVRYDVRLRGPDGQERSKTFRTKKEAERYERAHFAALDAGTWVDPRAGRITLEEWATEWRRTIVHLRPKTVSAYDSNLRNHILPALGHHELARLRPPVLRAWLAELCTKPARGGGLLAPLSVLQAYRTLNRVLAAAVDDELLARNPMSRIEPPRVETKPMRFLTHAEVARLADSIDQRYGPLVLLAAYGGLRAGELFALRWENVDLDHLCVRVVEQVQHVSGHLLVSAPKTDAGRRQVPIPAFVADELAARRTDEDRDESAGLLFAAPGGGYLRDSNFRRRAWAPAVKRAGLAPLRLHDLRHTCASLAIAAGADIKVLQRMLGHSSAALTLDRYGHLMPGQAEAVAARLDQLARDARPATSIEETDGNGHETGAS